MRCSCAPGVLTEAIEAVGTASSVSAMLDASTPYDPVLAVRMRHFQAAADASAALADPLPLLRAMLLTTPVASGVPLAHYIERWRSSVSVALTTRALAERSALVSPKLAWLAGLTHNLADYAASADAPCETRSADRSAAWLGGLDEEGWWADAVRFHALPLTRGKTAHPLVRIVQLAYVLTTRPQAVDSVDVRAALSMIGIGAAEANTLLDQTHAELHSLAQRFDLNGAHAAAPTAGLFKLTRNYARHAARSAIHTYLSSVFTRHPAGGDDCEPAVQQSLHGALRMLFGVERACVFAPQADGQLRAAPLFDPPAALAWLTIQHDDAHSLLARAMQRGQPCRFNTGDDGYAVIDAQIARVLGVDEYVCQPVVLAQSQPALLVCGGSLLDEHTLWPDFVAEWAAAYRRLDAPSATDAASTVASAVSDAIPHERVRRAVHEIANPLTIMRNYVNLLSARPGTDASVQRDLGIIGTEIERVARIVRGLIHEESITEASAEPTSINTLISELVRMTLGTLLAPNRISVQIDLNPDVQPILLPRDALKQVLFNLAKNAVEAMSAGGHLSFATRLIDGHGARQVEIEIADTGPGLPEHIRARLRSTAGVERIDSGASSSSKGGDHAGLGLPISHRLVARMGGSIDHETGESGTRFLIRLPIPTTNGQSVVRHERRY